MKFFLCIGLLIIAAGISTTYADTKKVVKITNQAKIQVFIGDKNNPSTGVVVAPSTSITVNADSQLYVYPWPLQQYICHSADKIKEKCDLSMTQKASSAPVIQCGNLKFTCEAN